MTVFLGDEKNIEILSVRLNIEHGIKTVNIN